MMKSLENVIHGIKKIKQFHETRNTVIKTIQFHFNSLVCI